ncbi:hypothetical protein P175DRAFT_0533306 [Aspergillus ochraceoroseus IBT 24754]|uniref:Uncharacterized protein n=1 Tax=Aspergillus ochraceoroseus IBT 24754 TaxID=1392256 RepID=A0A2T5LVK2_9EURO|nr:uncharacterized protein P175DRAFT_0533306 [Aspergillus ochraceoroseus IBT 24754]PTU20311.1 hypothetical protein P175DRAFT_0533306 [Aspergillus ochraceoroseus IBT 24754]
MTFAPVSTADITPGRMVNIQRSRQPTKIIAGSSICTTNEIRPSLGADTIREFGGGFWTLDSWSTPENYLKLYILILPPYRGSCAGVLGRKAGGSRMNRRSYICSVATIRISITSTDPGRALLTKSFRRNSSPDRRPPPGYDSHATSHKLSSRHYPLTIQTPGDPRTYL